MQDEEPMDDEPEGEAETIIGDEDKIASEPEFREWQANCLANTSALKVILKLTEFVDGSKEEVDDDDYEDEDEEVMQDEQTETSNVIDLD
jgi:hypothetical protein